MVSPREFERTARMLLRRMRGKGVRLVCEGGSAGAVWRLYSPRNGYRRPLASPPAQVADAMIAAGWLEREGEGKWRIAQAGREWLARAEGRRARREIVDPHGVRRQAEVTDESPLDWLARRRDKNGEPFLTAEQVAAGERLRRDYETGRLGQKVTASWDVAFSASERRRARSLPGGPDIAERALAARQRVHAALAAVGPQLDEILLEVCCLSRGLEAAERRLGWPRRSARLVLRIALERLAAHYDAKQTKGPRTGRILLWGLEDRVPLRALPEKAAPPAPEGQ